MVGVIDSALLMWSADKRHDHAAGRESMSSRSQHVKHYTAGPELRIN
jgi:hypothetical protein